MKNDLANKTSLIIVHHTGHDDYDFETTLSFHTAPKKSGGRGWRDIGYHYFIEVQSPEDSGGDVMEDPCAYAVMRFGRHPNLPGAHDFGQNDSIGVCLQGDWRKVKWTKDEDGLPVPEGRIYEEMFKMLLNFCNDMRRQTRATKIEGHKENEPPNTPTACPGFDPQIIRDALGWGD